MTDTWRQQAACRGMPPDLFVPDPHHADPPISAALAVCAGCKVQPECAAWAKRIGEFGIIAGGRYLRGRRGYTRRQPRPPCGSEAGYYHHVRHSEPACDACRAAHAHANQWRKQQAAS